jgi:hypothetical protein
VANIKFHWLLLGLDLTKGLRLIESNRDTNAIVIVVHKVKNLVVYANHEDRLNNVDWDDVVANPINELPHTLGP